MKDTLKLIELVVRPILKKPYNCIVFPVSHYCTLSKGNAIEQVLLNLGEEKSISAFFNALLEDPKPFLKVKGVGRTTFVRLALLVVQTCEREDTAKRAFVERLKKRILEMRERDLTPAQWDEENPYAWGGIEREAEFLGFVFCHWWGFHNPSTGEKIWQWGEWVI